MSRGQTKSDVQRNVRQSSVLKSPANEGKRPCGIERKQLLKPVRKSTRLQDIQCETPERKHLLPSPSASNSFGREVPQDSSALEKAPSPNRKRKRKRSQETRYPTPEIQEEPTEKRARASVASCAVEDKKAASDTDNKIGHPISHWIQERSWPEEYFKSGSQTWEDLGADREADKLAEEPQRQEEWNKKQAAKVNSMAHPLLARKRSSASIRRQYEELGIGPPSDLPREEKSAKYRNPAYEIELASKGSFMYESDLDITEESKALCQNLLDSAQTVVQDSLFRDDRFKTTCRKIHNENEAMVIQDITRLIVPSAKNLATCGATGLQNLVESVNRGWNSAIPITTPHPQPDYSVAFGQSAFTDDQLEKLKPFVGDLLHQPTDFSYLMATWRMYFPFLACEVKCGAAALDIADRQNAHSMTHAVRAVVELYKYAKWEEGFDWKKEVHREILAFSISHDDKAVRIYGHYPVIEDDRTTFYRHPIRDFSLMDLDGRDKWTAFKFTKNVYELWMPKHVKRICKAVDALPVGLDFKVSSASFASVASAENESELPDSQEMATPTSASQDTAGFKKPRLPPKVMLQQENDSLKGQLAQEREQSNQRLMELMDRLTGNESEGLREMKQENKELKEQIKELMNMLKQRIT